MDASLRYTLLPFLTGLPRDMSDRTPLLTQVYIAPWQTGEQAYYWWQKVPQSERQQHKTWLIILNLVWASEGNVILCAGLK